MTKPCGWRSQGIRNRWETSIALIGLALALTMQIGCKGLSGASSSVTEPVPSPQLNTSINHIIFMAQENRGFDHYFGKLPAYWQVNGYPSQTFDGLPSNASNPSFDGLSTVNAFHLRTVCVQNLSPGWNESHVDWNVNNPVGPWAGDGFVHTAAHFSQTVGPRTPPFLISRDCAPWAITMATT